MSIFRVDVFNPNCYRHKAHYVDNSDYTGTIVDYKPPKLSDANAPSLEEGIGYLFSYPMKSNRSNLSDVGIDSPLSFHGQTLKSIYDNPKDASLSYAFHNDAHPNGSTTATKVHTKEVVAFDGNSGFWMVQSVSRYPRRLILAAATRTAANR